MKLYVDSACADDVCKAIRTGFVSGITTNPSLVLKTGGGSLCVLVRDVIDHVDRVLMRHHRTHDDDCNYRHISCSVEVLDTAYDAVISQARKLRDNLCKHLFDRGFNLAIKVPALPHLFEAINTLTTVDNIDVNCTCCFTTGQLIAAASAGARYASLFYRRLCDATDKHSAMSTLSQARRVIDQLNVMRATNGRLPCEIIAGSIREIDDVFDAWSAGAHIVTAPYSIIDNFCKSNLTECSVEQFVADVHKGNITL